MGREQKGGDGVRDNARGWSIGTGWETRDETFVEVAYTGKKGVQLL